MIKTYEKVVYDQPKHPQHTDSLDLGKGLVQRDLGLLVAISLLLLLVQV